MSIFSSIKNAIFGHKKAQQPSSNQPTGQTTRPVQPPAGQRPVQNPTAQAPAMPQMQQPAPQPQVDVDDVLADLAEQNGQKLNYQSSIVDLMKLLGLDASLANRKELADELGYQGAKDGSAEMNIWLHKRVMEELEKNGGKVSAALRD
jgi:hypothetical protein